jgi:hypothetical protein
MNYEQGLAQLKQYLRGTAWEQEFHVYEVRLRENLRVEQLYGANAQQKAERFQVIDQLNRLAKRVNVSFTDLCLGANTFNSFPTSKPHQVTGNYTQLTASPTFTSSIAAKPPFPGTNNSNNTVPHAVTPLTATTSNSLWKIIAMISGPLAVFFALTTLYLLVTRSLPIWHGAPEMQADATVHSSAHNSATLSPTATTTPQVKATATDSTTQPATNLSSTTTNYPFTCPDCLDNIGVELQDIRINDSTKTMIWDFNITYNNNNADDVHGELSLEASTGETIQATGGTFTQFIKMVPGQTLPRSAILSSMPSRGVLYTVTLTMYSTTSNTYQSVLFNY